MNDSRVFSMVVLLGCLGPLARGESDSGTLRSFERAATEKPRASARSPESHETTKKEESSWLDFLLGVFFDDESPAPCRAAPARRELSTEITPTAGAPALTPYVRADLSHHWVRPDVRGVEMRVEGGYGAAGLEGRLTRFRESSPAARLDLAYIRAVLHVPLTARLRLGLGVGAGQLAGAGRTSGFSASVPMDLRLARAWAVELNPGWTKLGDRTMSDVDAGVRWGAGRASLRLGYRRLRAGDQCLSGPTAGLSFSF
jgi:hypothetical protein